MVGIMIATHGDFAVGLADSVRMIMGQQDNLETLSLQEGQDIEKYGEIMKEKIIKMDKGKGVLVLVDLFSASPYNQAAINKNKITDIEYRIVSGVNLPMLLEILGMRFGDASLDELTDTALTAGKAGIKNFEIELENFQKQ